MASIAQRRRCFTVGIPDRLIRVRGLLGGDETVVPRYQHRGVRTTAPPRELFVAWRKDRVHREFRPGFRERFQIDVGRASLWIGPIDPVRIRFLCFLCMLHIAKTIICKPTIFTTRIACENDTSSAPTTV